jgi:hypothetical protein
LAHVLEHGAYASGGKSDLPKSLNVGKLLAAFLKKHDRLREPEPPLEQPNFVNDILPSPHFAVGLFILGGQNEEGYSCRVEHLR